MEIATRRREQEVWQACDDLWAMHGEVSGITGDSIRERLVTLGKSKGSPNEIYKYRKTWIKSRKIDNSSALNEEETDPISRAVHMVHEQLKLEAAQEIERLQRDFDDKLKEKDNIIASSKDALERLMMEFSTIQKDVAEKTAKIAVLDEQLLAEVEVRKVTERELAQLSVLHKQEQAANSLLLNEIKAVFSQEMTKAHAREQDLQNRFDEKVQQLNQEKINLGHSYSDQLNEYKTRLYNQQILCKQLEDNYAQLLQEKEAANNNVLQKSQSLALLQQKNNELSLALASLAKQLQLAKTEQQTLITEVKTLKLAYKRAELTIARLRAIIGYNQS